MLIDHVKIKGRRGAGWIVLCGLLFLPSLASMILSWGRLNKIRLRNMPRVKLLGWIPFGSVLLWGAVILVLGAILCVAFLTMDTFGVAEGFAFFLVAVPQFLTGLFLMLFWGCYTNYKNAVDNLLRRIAVEPTLPPQFEIPISGLKFTNAQVREMLADLRDNDIVCFNTNSDGGITAWIVDQNLLKHLASCRQACPELPKVDWICSSCGAPNNTVEGGKCVYCGSPQSGK